MLTAGIGTKDEGACLAEGFEFCAPVVGPLPKDEYLAALADFKLEESFDLNAQYHLFRVDPTQTNRVWFHTRTLGKHVNDSPRFGPASGKEIINPPQCMHLDFTADGLVKEFGFYTSTAVMATRRASRRFAFFHGVGRSLPIPEMRAVPFLGSPAHSAPGKLRLPRRTERVSPANSRITIHCSTRNSQSIGRSSARIARSAQRLRAPGRSAATLPATQRALSSPPARVHARERAAGGFWPRGPSASSTDVVLTLRYSR